MNEQFKSIETVELTKIANAIRAKTGKSGSLTLDQMPAEIANIQTGGGSIEQIQSDWNQTDETAVDFIKNKPFGVIGYDTHATLLPLVPVLFSFKYEGSPYTQTLELTSETAAMWFGDWDVAEVVWDGVTYICNQQTFAGVKVIGNLDLYNDTGDNGVPFLIAVIPAAMTGDVDIGFIYSVYEIPNVLLYRPSCTFVEVEGQSYTKCELTNVLEIVEGAEYQAQYADHGVNSTATTYTADDGTYIGIGNPAILGLGDDNAFSYFIYTKTASDGTQSSAMVQNSANSEMEYVYSPPHAIHDISVTLLNEKINPIDSKFIQEVSWNSITDKPFYQDSSVVLDTILQDTKEDKDGDGVPESWEGIGLTEDLSDTTLVEGNTYTVTWNGVQYTSKCIVYEGMLPAIGNVAGDNDIPFILIRDTIGALFGLPCWFAVILGDYTDDGAYTCKVEGATVKCLDNKYLDFMACQQNEILPEVTASFTGSDGAYSADLTDTSIPIADGVEYTFVWDGVEYTYAASHPSVDAVEHYIFGNINTFTPFAVSVQPSKNLIVIATSDTSASHTFAIYSPRKYTIKEEYLPDNTSEGSALPPVTPDDAGKFLRVSIDGLWVAETIPNAEGAGF